MLGREELSEARHQWQLVLADPSRADLVETIFARFEGDLEQAAEMLVSSEEVARRGEAIGRLLRATLIMQHVRRAPKPYCIGPTTRDLRARLGGGKVDSDEVADEPEETDTEANAEATVPADDEPHSEAPYRAWNLGAPSKEDSEAERVALIEQIIDAFHGIALSPRDPANGYGPFAEAAPWMDEPQVRRSLAVTDRMEGADWGDGLSSARRSLLVRLASLGHVEEALAMLPKIPHDDARAQALGEIVGERIGQGDTAGPSPFQDPLLQTGDALVEFIRGITRVLEAPERPPPPALVRNCLAFVNAHSDEKTRSRALVLLQNWFCVGPPEEWFSVVRDRTTGTSRLFALFGLAKVARASNVGPAILSLAIETMMNLPEARPADWLDAIFEAREALPFPEALKAFARILTFSARAPRSWILQQLGYAYDFEAFLRWLGGEEAIVATRQALDDAVWVLG